MLNITTAPNHELFKSTEYIVCFFCITSLLKSLISVGYKNETVSGIWGKSCEED